MFAGKQLLLEFVFLITGLVESFPLFVFQVYTCFVFSVNGLPGHCIISVPVVTRHHVVGMLPRGCVSVLTVGTHLNPSGTKLLPEILLCTPRRVEYHSWQSHLSHPLRQTRRIFCLESTPGRTLLGVFHRFIKSVFSALWHWVLALKFLTDS